MASKGQRRRNKKKWKAPALAAIEKVEQPREKGRFIRVEEDPRSVVKKARENVIGIPTSKKNHDDLALQPIMESPLGMVIQSQSKKNEAARLWAVWQAYCIAERTYRIRYLGQSGSAKGAAIQMVPEQVQTNTDASIDLRTQEEKDADAVKRWMRWQGFLGCLSADRASALRQAEKGGGHELWRHGQPTQHGLWAYQSLILLAHFVEEGLKKEEP